MAYLFLLMLFFPAHELRQERTLPLKVGSISSWYVKDLTDPQNPPPGEEPVIIGYVYEIEIRFKVLDTLFFDNPNLCVYTATEDDHIQRFDIDSTMVSIDCEDCITIYFTVTARALGWLDCYVFPQEYELYPQSVMRLKKEATIARSVYLF